MIKKKKVCEVCVIFADYRHYCNNFHLQPTKSSSGNAELQAFVWNKKSVSKDLQLADLPEGKELWSVDGVCLC